MVCIRTIGPENAQDVRLSNEPFAVWGRMIPSLCEGRWSYRTEIFEIAQETGKKEAAVIRIAVSYWLAMGHPMSE